MYTQGTSKFADLRASPSATVASHSSSGSPSPRSSLDDTPSLLDRDESFREDYPQSLDGPVHHVFADGERAWVRTSSGVWVYGTVNYRIAAPRAFEEKPGAGVCYLVTMPKLDDLESGRQKWASWFAPSEGTIWPDSDRVRDLLQSQGVGIAHARPKQRSK